MSHENSIQHPQRLAAAGVLLAVLLVSGCPAQKPTGNGQSKVQTTALENEATSEASEQGKSEMSALQRLLAVFASQPEAQWSAFESVSGVQWRDPAPRPSAAPNAQPEYAVSRTGKLLLAGFGEADLPDGEVGEAAGARRGNEGESGVTLNGDARQVNSVAVMKFYPSTDYAAVLKGQFHSGTKVDLLAENCGGGEGADPENRKFYIVAFSGGTVYTEAYVDTEGGRYSPGSTTFEFYKELPADRIQAMNCRSVGKD